MKKALLIIFFLISSSKGEARPYGAPSMWCGWAMRQWFGGGPELNLARNWARIGHPTRPRIGAIVVWPHHVGYIIGKNGRYWIVRSGNDGGRIRERARSLEGAIAFRLP